MEFLFIVILIAYAVAKYAVKLPKPKQKSPAAPRRNAAAAKKPTPIPAVRAQKRAQMEQGERWRAAKQQQDDAEQLHAIHIDSCESKLDSLRVLHEAGILDKEEYAERVIRTKAKHARGEMQN